MCRKTVRSQSPYVTRLCEMHQYYFPVDSDKAVTAWIPLQPTPLEMGPLQFAISSHKTDLGRHLGISGANQHIIDQARRCGQLLSKAQFPICRCAGCNLCHLAGEFSYSGTQSSASVVPTLQQMKQNGYELVSDPFSLGEVSFHAGWTFHRADGNATDTAREVFTIIYIDQVTHSHPARQQQPPFVASSAELAKASRSPCQCRTCAWWSRSMPTRKQMRGGGCRA